MRVRIENVSRGYDLTSDILIPGVRPHLLEDASISETCAQDENASHHVVLYLVPCSALHIPSLHMPCLVESCLGQEGQSRTGQDMTG